MAENRVGNILYVDDDPYWLSGVGRELEEDGHTVTLISNATEAKRMIPEGMRHIHVSILDGDLGDGTGEELAGLMRQTDLSLRIIGLSSRPSPWADISFSKDGFDPDALRATVSKFLGRSE